MLSFKILCFQISWAYDPVFYFSILEFPVLGLYLDILNSSRASLVAVPVSSTFITLPAFWLLYFRVLSALAFLLVTGIYYYPHDQGNSRDLKKACIIIPILLFSLSRILFKTLSKGKETVSSKSRLKYEL